MACAGLKSSEKIFKSQMEEDNPTKRAVQMAQAMMSFAEECVFDDDCSITVKIGIHYGRTIAGIIGHHKPQFSLIGDSVNIANRCCSTAEDGKIALTEGAYEQVLKENLRFDKRKVENKGRGEMVTQVLRREKHNRNIRKPEGNNQAIDRLKSLMTMSIMETETAKNDIYDVPNLNNLDLDEPPKSQAVSAGKLLKFF